MQTTALPRITSIDILRALTMLLMIFVNDLWSLNDIPQWLEHTKANDDGMGLADVVFPAFLVIVGMSAPFAVGSRKAKGESKKEIAIHIIARSFALIVMGVFLVNGESINATATGMPRWIWFPTCCLCFILIWNNYPKTMNKKLRRLLQVVGWIILITMAIIYRSGENCEGRFATSWWGILGLIGWAYLVSCLVYVFAGDSIIAMSLTWTKFMLVNVMVHTGLLKDFGPIDQVLAPLGNGAMPAFVTAGIASSLLFIRLRKHSNSFYFIGTLLLIAVLLCAGGFALRFAGGISKIKATPSWVLICTSITFTVFAFIYWLTDLKRKDGWFNIIKPAGTNTLTCYLLPYFAYGLMGAFAFSFPQAVSHGAIGLLKSALFALLIVMTAGWVGKIGIRVKL